MAALQQTLFSLQSKFTPSFSLQTTRNLPSSSIRIGTNRRFHGGAGGAKMSVTAAASYASALVDVAVSNSTLETTSADVVKIEKIFSDELVLDFFSNPTIGLEQKREVLDSIVKSSEIQPHTGNFLNILVDANRIDVILDIVKEFEKVYNTVTDTELAVVTSVVNLEPQHLTQIAKQVQKLTGSKNVRVKTVIDPSLVAGFTVRYGNSGSKLIDMSVKKQLEDIAEQLEVGDIQLV